MAQTHYATGKMKKWGKSWKEFITYMKKYNKDEKVLIGKDYVHIYFSEYLWINITKEDYEVGEPAV